MSVTTTADEQKDSAIEHIKEAIKNLGEIIINQCWGHDDYSDDYSTGLKQSLIELITIRDRL